jgi:hypothetical protein|tara:strand:- start:186 stop:500 length:315 start_codon:yes stop_codon:yes gene_type:complete
MKKTRKQTILDNDLSMPAIMAEFHTYETGAEKAKYLREMAQLNLPYDVNWESLAQCHEGAKPWPSFNFKQKKDKDENILLDSFEVSTSAGEDKPLTHEELEALI